MSFSERYCASCGAANPRDGSVCFACGLSLKITAALHDEIDDQHLLQERYRILAQVGKGGFSAVYKAEDTHYHNHPVAIKAITLSGLKPSEVIEATEAFNRELLLLSGLKHPNLPHIYSHFADAECWYLVMDFIEGTTLEKHLETMPAGRLPMGEVFGIGLLLCNVLEYLHSRQPAIIFRDLKPANIMCTPAGHIALIDFGIARQFKPGQAKDTMPFGSPGYAAPEQYGKAQSSPRTDIYGLGVTLHQLISGDDPSQTPFRFAPLALTDEPTLAGLETLIMRMLTVDAEQRPANIGEVKEELQRIADAWLYQHRYGLPAQVAYPGHSSMQPPPFVGKSSAAMVPPLNSGMTSMTGGMSMGIMSFAKQTAANAGPNPTMGSSSIVYWPSTHAKKWNWMAIASLFFGFISIFALFFSCITPTAFFSFTHVEDGSWFFLLIPLLLMMLPSILAIVCGHIGRHRAKTISGQQGSGDMATTGMVMGYLFGSIYLGFICILFTFFMSFR